MSSPSGPGGARTASVLALLAAVVVLAGAAVYWPSLGAGFVGDDFMILDRLRSRTGLAGVLQFFRGEFFEYYRPLGFISHAADWAIAGPDPRQFHRTNLLLHLANGLLVFGIAWTLGTRLQARAGRASADRGRAPAAAALAGFVAALLFVLHASNHEAVVWVSARFDLVATAGALAAMWWTIAGGPGSRWGPALLFLAAILAKESAVALPIAAAGWWVFGRLATTRETLVRLAPWLAMLAVYAMLRQVGGGLPATGGAPRLPKAIALACLLALVMAGADGRWIRLRDAMRPRAGLLAGMAAASIATVLLAWAVPESATIVVVREKLTVAGFALYYLVTPFTDAGVGSGFVQPPSTTYARAALVGLPLLAAAAWALRRRLLQADVAWFLVSLFVATLLPISALTEGRRYLYLPSTAAAIAAGLAIAALRPRPRAFAAAAAAAFIGVSAVRIHDKLGDWLWAGAMTEAGARLVDEALAPACNDGHVVFLTSPVGVRGVYSHFYYETFALPRGCAPRNFQVVARLTRVDTHVDASWRDSQTIVMTVPDYRGNLVLSEDLRRFDLPLSAVRTRIVETPLGLVRAEPEGAAQRVTVSLPRDPASIHFFYFSDGSIRRLPDPPPAAAQAGLVLAGQAKTF